METRHTLFVLINPFSLSVKQESLSFMSFIAFFFMPLHNYYGDRSCSFDHHQIACKSSFRRKIKHNNFSVAKKQGEHAKKLYADKKYEEALKEYNELIGSVHLLNHCSLRILFS